MENNLYILNTITSLSLSGLVNAFISILMLAVVFLYVIFSVIVVRQVYLMSQVIITSSNRYVKFFAWLQLVFSFVFAYFILKVFIIQ